MYLSAKSQDQTPELRSFLEKRKANRLSLLLSSVALVGLLSVLDSSADPGVCDPARPSSGDTVTCSGDFTTSIEFFRDDLTINVEQGSSITTIGGPGIVNIGSTTINNHADIIVSNGLFFAAGIGIYGADETVSVNNYGDVSVTGPGTDGIRIFSDFGTVSVRNHGQINASDEDSRGMHLSIFNYRKPANRIDEAVIDLTNYAQITSGTQALEVGVSSFNGAGTVNIDNRGDLITTSEAGKGIEVTTNGETDLDIINSGNISGAGIVGIQALDGRNTSGNFDSDFYIHNSGNINLTNNNSTGILAVGIHEVTLHNLGDITVASDGIGAGTVEGDLTVTNAGNITSGNAEGIQLLTGYSGAIQLENTGAITAFSSTIEIRAVDDVHLINTGNLRTSDATIDSVKNISRYGNIKISNTGSITGGKDGLNANAFKHVELTNTNSITVADDAIYAIGHFDGVSITNSGDLTATGAPQPTHGILGFSNFADVTVQNSGNLSAVGPTGNGIYASAGESVSITNSGTIVASGTTTAAIDPPPYGTGYTIDVGASGLLSMAGANSTVSNSGNITVTGPDSFGILALAQDDNTLENNADVTATGSNSVGLASASYTGNLSINLIGGTVAGDVGLIAYASNNALINITNSGSIIGTGGVAVVTNDPSSPFGASSKVSFSNTGTVSGDILLGNGNDILSNTGTIAGGILNLGSGNDSFTHSTMGTLGSTVDGGSGNGDAFELVGTGTSTLDLASISNFEAFNVKSGTWSVSGDANFLNGSTVGPDAKLVSNGNTIGGEINVLGDLALGSDGTLRIIHTSQVFNYPNPTPRVESLPKPTTNDLNEAPTATDTIAPTVAIAMSPGNLTLASDSTTTFSIDNDSNSLISADGAVTFMVGSAISVDVVAGTNTITHNGAYTIVEASSVTDNANAETIDNSALFDFTRSVVDGNTLVLTSELVIQAATDDPNLNALNAVLLSLAGTADGDALLNALSRATTQDELNKLLEDVLPDDSFAPTVTQVQTALAMFNLVGTRMSGGTGFSGQSNGVQPANLFTGSSDGEAWGEIIGSKLTVDTAATFDGFNSSAKGFAFGADRKLANGMTFGAAASYIRTDTDHQGTSVGNATDQDTYGGLLYLGGNKGPIFFNGQIGYWNSEVATTRQITATSETAVGEFTSGQFAVQGKVGYLHDTGSVQLSPFGGLTYQLVNQDAYVETGSTANLSVTENEFESILGEVGFNISDTSTYQGHSFTPSLHASLQYEFGDEKFTTTAAFASGGNSFQTTSREFDPLAFNFGGGITLKTDTNMQLRARYNARMTDDLFENTGTLDLRFKF